VEVLTFGDVCERVEVGTTTETREVEVCRRCGEKLIEVNGGLHCPAFDSGTSPGSRHDRFLPPATRTVEVEVPVWETRCPPSILAPVEPEQVRDRTLAEDAVRGEVTA